MLLMQLLLQPLLLVSLSPGIVQHHLQSGVCTGASFPSSPLAAAIAEMPID